MNSIIKENIKFNKIDSLLTVIYDNVKKFQNLNIIDLGIKFFEDIEIILNLQFVSNSEIIYLLNYANLNKISKIFQKNYLIYKSIIEKLVSSINIVLNIRKNFTNSIIKEKKKVMSIEDYDYEEENNMIIINKSEINPLYSDEINDQYEKIMKGNIDNINSINNLSLLKGISDKICDSMKEDNIKNINFLNTYLNKMDFSYMINFDNRIYKKLNEIVLENKWILNENNNIKKIPQFDDDFYKILIDNIIDEFKEYLKTSSKKIFFRAIQTYANFNKKLTLEKETETDFKFIDVNTYENKIKNLEENIKEYRMDVSEMEFVIKSLNKEINNLNKIITEKDNLLRNYKITLDENLIKVQNNKPNEKYLNKKIDNLKDNIGFLHEKVEYEKDLNKTIILENDRLKNEINKLKTKSKILNTSINENINENYNKFNFKRVSTLNKKIHINNDRSFINNENSKKVRKFSAFNNNEDPIKERKLSAFNNNNNNNDIIKRNSMFNKNSKKNSQKIIRKAEKKIVTFNKLEIEKENSKENDEKNNIINNDEKIENISKKSNLSDKFNISNEKDIIKINDLSPIKKISSKKEFNKNLSYETNNKKITNLKTKNVKIKKKLTKDFTLNKNNLSNRMIKNNSLIRKNIIDNNNKKINKNYRLINNVKIENKKKIYNKINKTIKENKTISHNNDTKILFKTIKDENKKMFTNSKEKIEKSDNLTNKKVLNFFSTNNNFRKNVTNYSNNINKTNENYNKINKKTTLNFSNSNKYINLDKNIIKLKENITDNIFNDIFNKSDIKKIKISKTKKIFYAHFIQNIISSKLIDYLILATNNGKIKLDEPIFKNIEKIFFVNLEAPYRTLISKFKINNNKKEMNLPKFVIDKIIVNK